MTTSPELLAQYTDEGLRVTIANPRAGRGYQNAAEYLLQLPDDPELRLAIIGEAHIIQNTSPGWIYSGAVYRAIQQWRHSGRFPFTEANQAMLVREREAQERTGQRHFEPLQAAFGHLI